MLNQENIWQFISAISAIAQAFAVIYSLHFIKRQVQQQTKQAELQTRLAQAAYIQDLFELISPFNLQMINDRQ